MIKLYLVNYSYRWNLKLTIHFCQKNDTKNNKWHIGLLDTSQVFKVIKNPLDLLFTLLLVIQLVNRPFVYVYVTSRARNS